MSVARKTPKFAENPYFKSPLRQSRKSTSPSPSRTMHTSPFSQSVKASNNSGRKSPYSTATLKESVEALRQLRDYNNTVGSGSKDLRDIKATIYDRKEFEIITDFEKKHPQNAMNDIPPPMRNHISKVEAFIASRMPKKEEEAIKPHNLAWRTASHDAQARLLKEGATANQWPAPNLLEKMGGLYNKYIDDPSTSNEAIVKENPMRKSGMSVSTRKSTKLEEDHYAIEHDRYNNHNNNKENKFSYERYERRSVKESREPRLSYTSTSSKQAEEYQSRGKAELERMKVEAKRTQNQMKGKIDFINSLYEEMAMQPRDKPLMPSHRPVSPALDSRETPRSLMLVDDREIDALESSRRRKNDNRNENSRESRSRDVREERRVYNNNQDDNSINEKNTTFGDENYEEKRRPGSIQRTTAAHHNRTPSNLSIPRKVISGSNTSSLRSLNLAGSEYEGLESGNRGIGNNREFPNFEENFKGGDTERRRENNRPPLPGKRQQENDSNGFEQQDWAGDKGTPLQKSRSTFNPEPKSTKNFIEMNKSSSGVKSKKYANYEKVLRNVEETCKPLLETLKKISNKNEKELSLRCTANRKGMWSPCSAVSSSAKKDPKRKSSNNSTAVSPMKKELPFDKTLNIEGFGNNGSSIKNFYDEMNNLTLKITEAAGVMQKTLDQLERYKVEDTERGGRSARNREENFREINRFGYGEENEESEIY